MSQTPPPDPWGTPPQSGTEEGSEAAEGGGGFRTPPPPSFQPPPPQHDPSAQSEPPPAYPPPNPTEPPPGSGYPPPGYPPPGAAEPPPGSGYPPPPGYGAGGTYQPSSGGYPPPPGGYQPGGYPPPPFGSGLPTPPPVGPYASQAGGLAGWWARVGATVVDGLVFIIPSILVGVIIRNQGGDDAIIWVLYAAYIILLLGQRGQTVGNMAVHTRTVDAVSGDLPGYGKASIRWFVQFILNITVIGGIINILWPLWDDRNQTLHDKAAGTLVVRT